MLVLSPIAGLHVNELVSTEGTTARLNAQAGDCSGSETLKGTWGMD